MAVPLNNWPNSPGSMFFGPLEHGNMVPFILGLPLDTIKVKVRIRCDEIATAIIKRPSGVERYHLLYAENGLLKLGVMTGQNATRATKH